MTLSAAEIAGRQLPIDPACKQSPAVTAYAYARKWNESLYVGHSHFR